MSNGPELLTAEEVAERYRVSRMTVSRWVKSGQLEPLPLPGRILRFRIEDVEALAAPKSEPVEAAG